MLKSKLAQYIAIFCLLTSQTSMAVTYYVTQNGSDNNTGTSWAAAWRTLQNASNKVDPGDIVYIRNGKHPYKGFNVVRSGTTDMPIKFIGEDKNNPPIISGGTVITNWNKNGKGGIWTAKTNSKPTILVQSNTPLAPAENSTLTDGIWKWEKGTLYLKPSATVKSHLDITRSSRGGGITIKNQSWIVVENIECKIGLGSCISLINAHHNKISNITSKFQWRGVNIDHGSSYNLVEDCLVEGNREGIYILGDSHHNTVRNCRALHNGNLPAWKKNDRAGIAIGEYGNNHDNTIENCEIAYNGGPNSDPGLIVYKAPHSLLKNNNIHNNYGSGVFITINSDYTTVIGNIVNGNGKQAVAAGYKGIAGLSVRRSNHVELINNIVKNNFVSKDSRWPGKDEGPKGGIDIRGLPNDNMHNIVLKNNIVTNTQGGPNFYANPNVKVRR